MTRLFGWCFGPGDADHDACRHEIGSSTGIDRCPCQCHMEASSQ